MTFSHYEGEQPIAVTVVSIHDSKQMVMVVAEAEQNSTKMGVAKSKQVAKQALSVQRFSGGSSSIGYYLGMGVVTAAASAVYIVHSILTPVTR